MCVNDDYLVENVEAQSTNSSSVDELINEGDSLFNQGRYEEAIIWYDKALKIDPKAVDALIKKGAALDTLGKKQEALASLDRALTIDPTNQIALYLKSLIQK
jgi:tetratricopeptide (TPR) repeat protein